MTAEPPPDLSLLLITDSYRTICAVVESLCAQQRANRLELVIATPDPAAFELPDHVRELFAGVQVIQSALESLPEARAATIRAARAPVVVFGETHSFPERGWAEALIDTHKRPYAVVGPAIVNANPDSAISWSNLLLDYGPFVGCETGGPVTHLMGHNSAYKRDVLLAYGPGLESLLVSDTVLNDDLVARGHSMYFEPAARTRHLNVSRPRPWLSERLDAGRVFAAERGRAWSPWRRLLYAAGSPLIPAVRTPRALHDAHRVRWPRRGFVVWILPALVVGTVVSAAGEFLGYALGASERSQRRLYAKEIHRARHVAGRERAQEARASGETG